MFFKKEAIEEEIEILPPPPPFPNVESEESDGPSESEIRKAMVELKSNIHVIRGDDKTKQEVEHKGTSEKTSLTKISELDKKNEFSKKDRFRPIAPPEIINNKKGKPVTVGKDVKLKRVNMDMSLDKKLEKKLPKKEEDLTSVHSKLSKEIKAHLGTEQKYKIEKELEDLEKELLQNLEGIKEEGFKVEEDPFGIEEKAPEKIDFPKKQGISKERKIEKLPEIVQAENEINVAINGLKTKPKKPLIRFFKIGKKKRLKQVPMPSIAVPVDDLEAVNHKIHDARVALMDLNIAKAKNLYIKIMRLYNNLSPQKKARVYEKIRDLYIERKNAEKLNIKS